MGKRLEHLEQKLQVWMERANRSNHLLGLCALISFGGTISAAYPVTAVIVTAVLMAPRRWLSLSAACSLGSAMAGAVIVGVAHLLGYNEIHHLFPNLISPQTWEEASRWINDYGVWAIFGVGASPLPQMPLLIFFGIVDDRILEAFAALFAGKLLKYTVVAWVTQHFPEKLSFFKRINGKVQAKINDKKPAPTSE
jgi:membrane protein YqaA with SNARE-associated domain